MAYCILSHICLCLQHTISRNARSDRLSYGREECGAFYAMMRHITASDSDDGWSHDDFLCIDSVAIQGKLMQEPLAGPITCRCLGSCICVMYRVRLTRNIWNNAPSIFSGLVCAQTRSIMVCKRRYLRVCLIDSETS
jgi:hypothetical protein